MKCPRCQHENRSAAKFCEECATPFARACSRCGTELAPTAKFCPECAHPAGAVAGAPADARFGTPQSYTPKHLAEKILTSKAALEGERKQVTVLFADLKGSMELLADRDPEEARKLLDPVLERMMDAVHRYEGTVNQVMGDGIMALFGAPLAHEDHAVRACYAALRMQEAVKKYADDVFRSHGVTVRIRVGLNSGEVVVRAIGSDLHMDYTAVGQTTHLAARMEQLADPGTILLPPATLQLVEGYVEVKGRGAVPIKGLAEPVEVYELVGAGSVRSRLQVAVARGLTRFVGRDPEMEQLRLAVERAGGGHGQVVAVVGEPGVGKSRLFLEFTHSHRTQGWLVLESRSVSYGKATSYLPVVDLLKAYFQIEARDEPRRMREKVTGKLLSLDEALRPALPAFLALLDLPVEDAMWQVLDPPQRRQRTLDAVKRLLLRESQVQPLLVVFEDLHWIDSETQAFLDSVVDSVPTAQLLLLVNYRPEYQHGWGGKTYYTQLRVDPLPPETAVALLASLLGGDPALQPLTRLLIERTEGNPFFLEESVRGLVETGTLLGKRGVYQLVTTLANIQVPATVQAVVATRMDRLPPREKSLLQTAAVIGKDVPFVLLREIVDFSEEVLRHDLTRLQAAEFLYETSCFPEIEYTFKHALTHEVAYGGLLREKRRTLHARIVDAIEGLTGERVAEHAESLARHAVKGEVWDKAVEFLCQAGAKAYARVALQESVERYEEALELLPRLPASPENVQRAIDVRLRLYRPLATLGRHTRVIELLGEAEQLACQLDDKPRLGRISINLSGCSQMSGRFHDGIRYARQALSIAETLNDDRLRLWAAHSLGISHYALGETHAAIELLTPLVDGPGAVLAKRLPTILGSVYTMSCSWLTTCFALRGEYGRAVEYAECAVQDADASEAPQAQACAYLYRAIPLVMKGEFAKALAWLDRAIRLSEEKGLLYWFSVGSILSGWALSWVGRPDEGLPSLQRGMTLQEGMGTQFVTSGFYVMWALGLLGGGKMAEAKHAAERALDLAIASGERGNATWALLAQADITAAEDPPDFERASILYERAKALAEELDMRPFQAHCHLGLGKLYRCTGRHEQAHEHLTTATTMYREMDMGFWLTHAETEMALGPERRDDG